MVGEGLGIAVGDCEGAGVEVGETDRLGVGDGAAEPLQPAMRAIIHQKARPLRLQLSGWE